MGEIGWHGNRPWLLSQIDKPRSNPELERQSCGGQGKKDLGVLMPNPNPNIQIQQFCCVILMFSLPFLLTGSCDGVMAGFQKRWHFCPLSHLPGVCLPLMLCFCTVLAWGAHMKYLVWKTFIGLCLVPRISVEGLTKGLTPLGCLLLVSAVYTSVGWCPDKATRQQAAGACQIACLSCDQGGEPVCSKGKWLSKVSWCFLASAVSGDAGTLPGMC